jgi:hypothetical protein
MPIVSWLMGTIIAAIGTLVNLLVIQPRVQRRARHEVTNYRVIVTRGQRVDAAHRDQFGDLVVRRGRDGDTDIIVPREARPPDRGTRQPCPPGSPLSSTATPVYPCRWQETDRVKHCRSVITQRARKANGSENVLLPGRACWSDGEGERAVLCWGHWPVRDEPADPGAW